MTAMRFILGIIVGLLCMPPRGLLAADPPPLVLERTIPLKGVTGRIDHMAVDLRRNRLFVAELGNGTVDVVDLAAGTVVHRIDGLKEPQGVGYAPAADILAVASAGDGSVRLFRGGDFGPIGSIKLGDDADNVRLDARTGDFIVGYGQGGLAVIDPARAFLIRRIPLPAHPEGFQLGPDKARAFVNVPDARQIAVVDMAAGRQVVSWQTSRLHANFPMALAPGHAMIAVVFRSPARLVTLDTDTGKQIATVAACGDADDVFFDAKRKRIYVSCGAGSVDGWRQDGAGYRRLTPVKTAYGARTSLFVPDLDRLYVAARAGFFGLGSNAAILVLRPVD